MEKIKLVFIGDHLGGQKAALIQSYAHNSPATFIPPLMDHAEEITRNGKKYLLQLWDTTGQEVEQYVSFLFSKIHFFLLKGFFTSIRLSKRQCSYFMFFSYNTFFF